MGRLSEARIEYQLAQELDPERDHLSEILFEPGEQDRAIELKRRSVDSDPGNGYLHYELGDFLARNGDYRGWVTELEQTVTLFGLPELKAPLEDAFTHGGYQKALRVWPGDLERTQAQGIIYMPITLAEVYSASHDKQRAFYWLEDAYQHYRQGYSESADGGMSTLNSDWWLAPLHADPRYEDLLHRVGLPE